jgi:hypothetical protein
VTPNYYNIMDEKFMILNIHFMQLSLHRGLVVLSSVAKKSSHHASVTMRYEKPGIVKAYANPAMLYLPMLDLVGQKETTN